MLKPTRAGVRLAAWLKRTGTTQKEFADKLGTAQQNVSEWIRGGHAVSLKHALKIQKLTKIRPEDWSVAVEPESGTDVTEQQRATGT